MQKVFVILGKETKGAAKGEFNTGLFEVAKGLLKEKYQIISTVVEDGYDVKEEIEKYKEADIVLYQYPVFWFMMPSVFKKYIDDVFTYGVFHAMPEDGVYGTGGLMKGKKFMLSTTWNSPREVFDNKASFFKGLSVDEMLVPMRKIHEFCGFEELDNFSCHGVVVSPDYDGDKKRYEEHLKMVFNL